MKDEYVKTTGRITIFEFVNKETFILREFFKYLNSMETSINQGTQSLDWFQKNTRIEIKNEVK